MAQALLGALLAATAQALVLGTAAAQGQEPAAARTAAQELGEAQALVRAQAQSQGLVGALEAAATVEVSATAPECSAALGITATQHGDPCFRPQSSASSRSAGVESFNLYLRT